MSFASNIKLADSPRAKEYRARFADSPGDIYRATALDPVMLEGDVLLSNTFWHGRLIGDAMAHVAKVSTNGKAEHVMTAQEDTAILTALLRAAIQRQVDFSRILLIPSASNFDRQPWGDTLSTLPFSMDGSGGLEPALQNLYLSAMSSVN